MMIYRLNYALRIPGGTSRLYGISFTWKSGEEIHEDSYAPL